MQKYKGRAAMAGLFGGVAVLSSGCSVSDIGTILNILKLLGII